MNRRVIAIIPAAGRGKRMGRLKQLLPFGGSTMMETVIATAVASEVDGVVVVVNEEVRHVAERHDGERCQIKVNPDPDSDMLTSVQIGWQTAKRMFDISDDDGILLLPGDQPGVAVNAINDVRAIYQSLKSTKGVIATYSSRRGHPAIYPSKWIDETIGWPAGMGLNELNKQHAADLISAPQAGPIPLDINTPDDYGKVNPDSTAN